MKNRSPEVRKARAIANLRRADANPWASARVCIGRCHLANSWRVHRGHRASRYAQPLAWPVFAPQPGDVKTDPDDMPF